MGYRDDLRDASAEVRPTAGFVFKALSWAMLTMFALGIISYGLGWVGETARVAREQVGTSALLKKYEWFKDASAQLDKKQADIAVYESRLKNLESSYAGVSRGQWPRDDREQYNVWSSEIAGVRASFNALAADYNAQMAKINYAFTNLGDMPKGSTNPLPRDYKPYVSQ